MGSHFWRTTMEPVLQQGSHQRETHHIGGEWLPHYQKIPIQKLVCALLRIEGMDLAAV